MATEIINFKMNLEERIEKMMEKRGEVWKCIVCGKVAQDSKARGNLKRHVETHLEGVSHPCDICGHSSTSSGGLYQHKAKKHSELRPDRLYKQKKLAQAINNHIDLNLIVIVKGYFIHTYTNLINNLLYLDINLISK